VNATFLSVPPTYLRKQNRIKTIHASLQIEGNTLSETQVTSLLENKRIVGPEKDIQEVLNAVEVYDNLNNYKSTSEKSFTEIRCWRRSRFSGYASCTSTKFCAAGNEGTIYLSQK
jgi:uncharacterized protein YfbU (UPF0304 family)